MFLVRIFQESHARVRFFFFVTTKDRCIQNQLKVPTICSIMRNPGVITKTQGGPTSNLLSESSRCRTEVCFLLIFRLRSCHGCVVDKVHAFFYKNSFMRTLSLKMFPYYEQSENKIRLKKPVRNSRNIPRNTEMIISEEIENFNRFK